MPFETEAAAALKQVELDESSFNAVRRNLCFVSLAVTAAHLYAPLNHTFTVAGISFNLNSWQVGEGLIVVLLYLTWRFYQHANVKRDKDMESIILGRLNGRLYIDVLKIPKESTLDHVIDGAVSIVNGEAQLAYARRKPDNSGGQFQYPKEFVKLSAKETKAIQDKIKRTYFINKPFFTDIATPYVLTIVALLSMGVYLIRQIVNASVF